MTQKTLSAFRSDGRGLFRFRTATCCRRARISVWSAARSAKILMILCMPERVSGGDAKFQGFCDGWNKWEGQPNPRPNNLYPGPHAAASARPPLTVPISSVERHLVNEMPSKCLGSTVRVIPSLANGIAPSNILRYQPLFWSTELYRIGRNHLKKKAASRAT